MMNITTLKQTVNNALQSGSFTISGNQLNSPPVTSLLTDFFTSDQFVLSGASNVSESDTNIVIGGQMSQALLGLSNLQARATFSIDNNNIAQIHISMTGLPSDWKLSTTFPSLGGGMFDDFVYGNPELILDSQVQTVLPANFPENYGYVPYSSAFQDQIVRGLSMRATLNVSTGTTIASLDWIPDSPPWTVNGAIELVLDTVNNKYMPGIRLASELSGTHTPKTFHGFEISFILTLAAAWLEPGDTTESLLTSSFMQLEADVQKDIEGAQPLDIPVYIRQFSKRANILHIRSNLADATSLMIHQVAKLIGNSIDAMVPDSLPVLDDIHLENIELCVSPGRALPLSVSATVSYKTDDGWPIFGDLIVFRGLEVTFSYSTGSNSVSAVIYGSADVSGGTLEAFVNLPDLTFTLDLEEEEIIDIAQLVKTAANDSISMPQIDCTQFKLTGDIKNKMYSFQAVVTTDWDFNIGTTSLGIRQVEMFIKYSGGTQSEISGQLAGIFTIAAYDILVSAEYDSAGNAWTFEGSTGTGQQIPVGTLMTDIASKFGVAGQLPASLSGMTVENLRVTFNTGIKDFAFTAEIRLPVGDSGEKEVDITVYINLQHTDGSFSVHFSGHMVIDGKQFDIIFDKDHTATTFIAAYHQDGGNTVTIKDMVALVSDDAAEHVPDGMEISLLDALMAYEQSTTTGKKFLFEVDMAAGVDLTQLPLVGKFFTPEQTLKITLQALALSQNFPKTEIDSLNGLIPEGVTPLPSQDLNQGVQLHPRIQFGHTVKDVSLPLAVNSSATAGAPLAPSSSTPDTSVKWINLQKNFGPIHIGRVGVSYKEKCLWFLLDASLATGGLNISLEGLSVHSPINDFKPVFGLNGLGIDYRNGAVEIGGAFLKTDVERNGLTYTEYDGTAIIRAKAFTLSAIGSYAEVDGHTSLFIYAVLNMPLGGPAFFFVEGLAAGFGYNRSLILPPIDQIAPFPLVEEAMGKTPGVKNTGGLADELAKLRDYIPPDIGECFIAVGLKFSTFKIVDSFALLSVAFGKHFEIDLLGLSRATVPPRVSKSPLAVVELALKARFAPDEGILAILAQLTSASYILSKNCHLTGGFAFYCWFPPNSLAGDFVITLGGYHPHFKKPSHYPTVPRLGFHWQVTKELSIKGDVYFALCSHALMAGGHLEALWHSGPIKAWFKAGADFLVSWKPLHYEARIYIDLGASYTFWFFGTRHITIDVGADLSIWGPEFAGKATIHLWIVSFTVHFGSSSSKPNPIDWHTFKTSFLPADDKINSIAAKDGVSRTMKKEESSDGKDHWVVNPKHFTLTTDTAVPIISAAKSAGGSIDLSGSNTSFGIGSMAIPFGQLTSSYTVSITKTTDGTHVEDLFDFTPIKKKIPAGLWGKELTPDLNGTKFIDNAACGFEITPKAPPTAGTSKPVYRKDLAYSTTSMPTAYNWTTLSQQTVNTGADDNTRKTGIENAIVAKDADRQTLLKYLGMDDHDVWLDTGMADQFLVPPRILQ